MTFERIGPSLVASPTGGTNSAKEPEMAKVDPYYSINPTDPDVYHNHDDCPPGSQIPAHNRRSGTNDYRRCDKCQDMG